MSALLACMSVYHVHAWCPQKSDYVSVPRDCRFIWFYIAMWCWELQPGSLKEKQMILTAEPSPALEGYLNLRKTER